MYYQTASGSGAQVDFNVYLSDGAFYHVLLAVNGTEARLFVDDVQVLSYPSASCSLALNSSPPPPVSALLVCCVY